MRPRFGVMFWAARVWTMRPMASPATNSMQPRIDAPFCEKTDSSGDSTAIPVNRTVIRAHSTQRPIHTPMGRARLNVSAIDDEALFVKHLTVLASKLDFPVARALRADRLAAVGAIAGSLVGADVEAHRLYQSLFVVPTMVDRGRRGRLEARIEIERARSRRQRGG